MSSTAKPPDHADPVRGRDRRAGDAPARGRHHRPRAACRREDLRNRAQKIPSRSRSPRCCPRARRTRRPMRRPSGCSRRPRTPQAMAKLTVKQIEKLIYPVSFYRYKARYIKATCAKLLKDFGGKTPVDDGGAADAAGRRAQDREPGADSRVSRARRTSASTRTCIASRTGLAGCARRRRTKRSRRCIARRNRDGGRTSTSTSSHGDRTCAGRCIRGARRAPSRTCARASA